jgi:hypothetical protein
MERSVSETEELKERYGVYAKRESSWSFRKLARASSRLCFQR